MLADRRVICGELSQNHSPTHVGVRRQVYQSLEYRTICVDITGCFQMAMIGEVLEQDDVGDVGLDEAQDDELVDTGGHLARIERDDPDAHVGQPGHLEQLPELSQHYGRALDDPVQYRLVQHRRESRGLRGIEEALPVHPGLDALLDNIGRQPRPSGADERTRIVGRLEQPWHDGQAVVADRIRCGFQAYVVGVRQPAGPPGTSLALGSQIDEPRALLFIDPEQVAQPGDIDLAGTTLPRLEAADLPPAYSEPVRDL